MRISDELKTIMQAKLPDALASQLHELGYGGDNPTVATMIAAQIAQEAMNGDTKMLAMCISLTQETDDVDY